MAVYSLSPGFLTGVWKSVNEAYLEDRVTDAYAMVEAAAAAGQGNMLSTYRLIEGEALTRESSRRVTIADGLDLEWIDAELPHAHAVAHVIFEATMRVSRRLKWDRREKVLATILTHEANEMWNSARYGYCIDKIPYDKICLPRYSCQDPNELFRVTSHEFAHVVILNTAQAREPHWLDEGIACLMEGRNPASAQARLRHHGTWLPPDELERVYGVDRREAANMSSVGAAYDQATVIACYLHSLKGDDGIVDLLKRFADQALFTELLNRIRNRDQADGPLRQVYGFGENELFDSAKAWNPASPPVNS